MFEKHTFIVKIFVKYKSMVLTNRLFNNVLGSKYLSPVILFFIAKLTKFSIKNT
jgi:hypothetical protein